MSEAYTEQDLQRAKSFVIGAGGVEICLCPDENCRPRFESELAAEFARIRSEARAGMREACAGHLETDGGLDAKEWAAEIRKLPDTAADEAIERIKREARLEARIDEWRDAVVYFLSADLHGNDIEKIKEYIKSHSADLDHQLAALSGKEPSHD